MISYRNFIIKQNNRFINKCNMEKEKVKIDREYLENDGDYTGRGPWEMGGETYTYVEDIPSVGKSDGEDHTIIVRRESDGKFFSFFWWYHHRSGDYNLSSDYLEEVFQTTKITYE